MEVKYETLTFFLIVRGIEYEYGVRVKWTWKNVTLWITVLNSYLTEETYESSFILGYNMQVYIFLYM